MTTARAGSGDALADASFSEVFADALAGDPCVLRAADGTGVPLPVENWHQSADRTDLRMVEWCEGPTLDVGCGPGRMCEALLARGGHALGLDVVPEAVQLARERGAAALVADVFAPVPAEGLWETALLADGNLGIGGDPVALLRRLTALLEPRGRVVAEVEPEFPWITSFWARIETAHHRSRPFRWAVVGADAVPSLARAAGLDVLELHAVAGRSFAVLAARG